MAAQLQQETRALLTTITHARTTITNARTTVSTLASVFFRADGSFPLFLCWLVALVEHTTSNTALELQTQRAPLPLDRNATLPPYLSLATHQERVYGTLLQLSFLSLALSINVLFHFRTHTTQFQTRKKCVERFLQQLEESTTTSTARAVPHHHRPQQRPVWNLKPASVSVVPTFREGVWQLVPSNLLVQQEIIALSAGARCPGKVRSLDDPAIVHERATTVPWRTPLEEAEELRRLTASRDAGHRPQTRRLLNKSGQLRRYVLLETPLVHILDDYLTAPDPPKTRLEVEWGYAQRIALRVAWGAMGVTLVACAVRLFVRHVHR